jgi:hypothetical protein
LLALGCNIQIIQGQFSQEYVEKVVLGGLNGPRAELTIYVLIDGLV